ncbi:hypothetical protein KGO5_04277 [Sinorhizobium sp. KGO-5]|uniref:hypothetical protein n=1 Tax=Sinorhizobium sp. KGO-5 TaxID=1470810 RepID=UPI00294A2CA0|nr:hypothetical protein KGO5_04277 [Sinorhizobium sp. KGO-5]
MMTVKRGCGMSWEAWGPALVSSGTVAILSLAGGYLLKAFVEKGVQHGFDREIEKLKADLRTKELEIKDLRAGALAAMSSRYEELEKRRIKAAEALWSATVDQSRFRMAVSFVSHLNVDAIFKTLKDDPVESRKLSAFGETLWKVSGVEKALAEVKPNASQERLFAPPKAWASFAALRSVYSYATAILTSLRTGGVLSLKDISETNEILKIALPHQSSFIEKYPDSALWHLIDELEEKVLSELLASFDTSEADLAAVQQASKIMRKAAEESQPKLPQGLDERFRVDPPPLS